MSKIKRRVNKGESPRFKQLPIRVTAEFHQKVKEFADELGITMNQLVTEAVEERINSRKVPLKATAEGYFISVPHAYWLEQALRGYCGVGNTRGEVHLCDDCSLAGKKTGCRKPVYGPEIRYRD